MIVEYYRPASLDEALSKLARTSPKTVPLGGGTQISRWIGESIAVVDLQQLALNQITPGYDELTLGATTKLQQLIDYPDIPSALKKALVSEGGRNYRNQATIAGAIVSSVGRSAFVTGLLALNAQLSWLPGAHLVGIGDYLALRDTWNKGQLIEKITIPAKGNLSIEWAARTPVDRPIVCVAVQQWASGRIRIALGGYGKSPVLVLDGPVSDDIEEAVRHAYNNAGDQWAGEDYRSRVAADLVRLITTMRSRG